MTLLKVTQFLSLSKESLLKFSENVQKVLGLQEDLNLFKSDTFENFKSFVSSDVHSQTSIERDD